jgi:hypothetical protein
MRRLAAVALMAGVVCCSTRSQSTVYCVTDSECSDGQVCGTESCSGFSHCLRAECACRQDGLVNPCGAADAFECTCNNATCRDPWDSCGNQLCPGVCEQGQSCQFCLDEGGCGLVEPCLGSSCIVALDGSARCRPTECREQVQKPPQCGNADSPCGSICPTSNSDGRKCGEDPLTGASLGSCGAHHYCYKGECQQDPQYLLCEGDLMAMDAEISVEELSGPMPLPAGGIITDGTYDLVAEHEFDPYAAASRYLRGALRFTNGATRVEHIYDRDPSSQADPKSPHRLMAVRANDSTLSFNVECPDSSQVTSPNDSRGFSVAGEELWLFQRTVVEIYKRRPD